MRKALIAAGGVTAVSAGILSQNNWDVNSIGAVRFARAGLTFASIAADYKYSVYFKKLPDDENLIKEAWSACHTRSAKRMLGLCETNKGVFIKVGQHLGAMEYILPSEYCTVLKVLHNKAPTSPIEEVFAVIKQDLKTDVDELFVDFAKVPLGAASLAQCYKAKLKSGDVVAVKVQHRDVKANSQVDMKTMEILVNLAEKLFSDFKFGWLADITRKNLPKELDFLNEGRNAEKISHLMRDKKWLVIPKIYWKYCSERVLVMEFCDGGLVNDLTYMKQNGIDPQHVGDKLGSLYSEMIFIHGYVHSDPHPGNVIVNKDENGNLRLCLLDHGLYASLTSEFRYSYSQLWLCILNSDIEGMKKYCEELGVGVFYNLVASIVTGRSWATITDKKSGGILTTKITKTEQQYIKANVSKYIPQITAIFENIPRPMILVLKTNDLLRGVESSLKIRKTMASFLSMSKTCVRAVYSERIRLCKSNFCVLKNMVGLQWGLFRIRTFQFYLWFKSIITLNSEAYD